MTTQSLPTPHGSLVSLMPYFCELQAHSQPSMTKLQPPKTSGKKQSGYALCKRNKRNPSFTQHACGLVSESVSCRNSPFIWLLCRALLSNHMLYCVYTYVGFHRTSWLSLNLKACWITLFQSARLASIQQQQYTTNTQFCCAIKLMDQDQKGNRQKERMPSNR